MKSTKRSVWRVLVGFAFRSTVVHFCTYIPVGGIAFYTMTHHYDETTFGLRDLHDPHVLHWGIPAQVVRGILFALVLFPLRPALLNMKRWGGLVVGSILFVIGSVIGANGAIESWVIASIFSVPLFLVHVPEVVVQTALYGYLLLAWERHVERKYELSRMPPNTAPDPTPTAP